MTGTRQATAPLCNPRYPALARSKADHGNDTMQQCEAPAFGIMDYIAEE